MSVNKPAETVPAKRPKGVRVLVAVLVAQLVIAAVLIYFALAGWPWVPKAPATVGATSVPARFLPGQPGDGVATPTADNFNQARAFALLRRQVELYRWRPAGSPASRRLGVDLRRRLPGGRFEALSGANRRLRNVVGVIAGRKPAIVVGAHYDVEARPRGFVGANDGAAGTAAVVELARALAARPVAGGRELRFVLFDGEEEPPGSTDFLRDALRGSKAYAAAHRREVGQMILLGYVANRGLQLPREGSSNAALWARLRAAAARVGTQSSFPDRTGVTIYDDHTPFLDRGIASIDLIDFDYPWRDTLADNLSKVTPRALDVTGESVFALLDELRRR